MAGLAFGQDRLVQGTVALGYLHQRFTSRLYPTIAGLAYDINLRWHVTPLTTLSLAADKTIQRSPIIDVAGIEQQQFSLGAAHELLRTLILRPSVSYTVNRFRGGSRRDHYASAGPVCHMAGRAARAGGRRAAPRPWPHQRRYRQAARIRSEPRHHHAEVRVLSRASAMASALDPAQAARPTPQRSGPNWPCAAIALLFLVGLAALLRVLAPARTMARCASIWRHRPRPAGPARSGRPARGQRARRPRLQRGGGDCRYPGGGRAFVMPTTLAAGHERARDCLAAAAWYEAGDDPSGERAVIQVVLNRARHRPCRQRLRRGVPGLGARDRLPVHVHLRWQPGHAPSRPGGLGTRSRHCRRGPGRRSRSPRRWATHYHADYVVPKWRDSLTKLAQVGAHLFYRWQGWWGTAPAFRRHTADPAAEPLEPRLAALSPAHDADKADKTRRSWPDWPTATKVFRPTPAFGHGRRGNAGRCASGGHGPRPRRLLARHDATTGAATLTDTATIRLTFDPALFPAAMPSRPWKPAATAPPAWCWAGAATQPRAASTPWPRLSPRPHQRRRRRVVGLQLTPRTDKAQCLPPPGQRAGSMAERR
jgi:hypothetical protein